MRMPYIRKQILIPMLLSLLAAVIWPGLALADAGDPLPAGVNILDAFASGKAEPVGRVHSVAGAVVLIHAESPKKGYAARASLPIFKGDTVVTRSKGHIRVSLNDGSAFVMTPLSRVTVDESVFDPGKKQRLTFLGMDLGKARFLVNKLLGFSANHFRVTTRTAILGVRGSDFVSAVQGDTTVATTLVDTRLEVASATVSGAPVLLKDFERSSVKKGQRPTRPEAVSHTEVQRLKKEFAFEPDNSSGGASLGASAAASPLSRAKNCSATRASDFSPGNKTADRIRAWIGGGGN
jgi:hypothetical protein